TSSSKNGIPRETHAAIYKLTSDFPWSGSPAIVVELPNGMRPCHNQYIFFFANVDIRRATTSVCADSAVGCCPGVVDAAAPLAVVPVMASFDDGFQFIDDSTIARTFLSCASLRGLTTFCSRQAIKASSRASTSSTKSL